MHRAALPPLPRRRCYGHLPLICWVVAALGCGHTIGPAVAANHPGGFDFKHPPCEAAEHAVAADEVEIRYLGAGGLYVGWRGQAILTGPFFSNPGYLRTAFGRIRIRPETVALGLSGLPVERIGAILHGHAHYDHIGDLPEVARRVPRANLYLNTSGQTAFDPDPALSDRALRLVEPGGAWQRLEDVDGRPLPFRVRTVASSHAPHFGRWTLWQGETRQVDRLWRRRRNAHLKAGDTDALVLDLLAPAADGGEEVRFRVHYQDAASRSPNGVPPADLLERPYDLVVVVMASAHLVRPYPRTLLETVRPRYVLVTHYENFFRRWERRRGFVPLLTRGRAEAFLRRTIGALAAGQQPLTAPAEPPCGPASDGWAMPLVGETIVLRPSPQEEEVRE